MGLKLNLGCGDNFLSEYVNVDCVPWETLCKLPPNETVFRQANLEHTWPWADGSVSYILAEDIIEHLPDKIDTMNEIWRVLEPDGLVNIFVPTTKGAGAWCDPTHVSYWNRESFWYHEVDNFAYKRLHKSYGIIGGFSVHQETEHWYGNVHKLRIILRKVVS